ncbi:hypothetical protein SteCoe_22856 [Stentor coeruleus]|uniref:Uncharacterized protein n=1 Tax=Stentor coeruleus TaxID=5963 RepID=A0A1R2BL35_9CILI|nr:hypothetical protein SteCoe_22856 [Stentor coeruleus]
MNSIHISNPSFSVPHLTISLDSLKAVTGESPSTSSCIKKSLYSKVKKDALKLKANYLKLQEIQQTPKISAVSRALASSKSNSLVNTLKSQYISKLKAQTRSGMKSQSQDLSIDYSQVKSIASFAISKMPNKLSSSCIVEPEGIKIKGCDMYARGQKHLVKKNTYRKKMIEEYDRQHRLSCTFTPNLEKGLKNSSQRQSLKNKSIGYRSLTPAKRKISYAFGCNASELKEKCIPMHNYMAISIA